MTGKHIPASAIVTFIFTHRFDLGPTKKRNVQFEAVYKEGKLVPEGDDSESSEEENEEEENEEEENEEEENEEQEDGMFEYCIVNERLELSGVWVPDFSVKELKSKRREYRTIPYDSSPWEGLKTGS